MIKLGLFVVPFYALDGLRYGYLGAIAAILGLLAIALATKKLSNFDSVPWVAWPSAMATFIAVGITMSAVR